MDVLHVLHNQALWMLIWRPNFIWPLYSRLHYHSKRNNRLKTSWTCYTIWTDWILGVVDPMFCIVGRATWLTWFTKHGCPLDPIPTGLSLFLGQSQVGQTHMPWRLICGLWVHYKPEQTWWDDPIGSWTYCFEPSITLEFFKTVLELSNLGLDPFSWLGSDWHGSNGRPFDVIM